MRAYPIILLIFLISCQTQQEDILYENNTKTDVYFCPKDNCSDIFYEALDRSDTIYCAFYDIDNLSLINADRIFLEKDNIPENIEVRTKIKHDDKSSYMHNKFCILDNETVITGSMNPTLNGMNKNNNNLIIIRSSLLSRVYLDEFEELWQGDEGEKTENNIISLDKKRYEVYFSPEDDIAGIIKALIYQTERSIHFMTFSFTHKEITDAILWMSHKKNITVEGIYEKRLAGRYSNFKVFSFQNFTVFKDDNPFSMHHKVFIIDERIVVAGSFNPSKNAERNSENVLVIYDSHIAIRFIEEYYRILPNEINS